MLFAKDNRLLYYYAFFVNFLRVIPLYFYVYVRVIGSRFIYSYIPQHLGADNLAQLRERVNSSDNPSVIGCCPFHSFFDNWLVG